METETVSRAEYDALIQEIEERAKRIEKLVLAQKYGLSEQDLEGDFDSPADMRRHAERTSHRKELEKLEERLSAKVKPTQLEGLLSTVQQLGNSKLARKIFLGALKDLQ